MAWFVHRTHPRPAAVPEAPAPRTVAATDIEAMLVALRTLIVRVPCAGCGGGHEMTCAELVARQVFRGSGWDSEECDDTVTLGTVLSLDDVTGCNGDAAAIGELLARRGYLQGETAVPAVCNSRERHHMLLAH